MMKYIDADKLIAEIKRLTNQKKNQLKRFSDEDYTCSVASSINCELSGNLEVLSIIKSLQQEQPEVEKEIDDWYNTMGIPVTVDALKETARHFYELGLNARKEE